MTENGKLLKKQAEIESKYWKLNNLVNEKRDKLEDIKHQYELLKNELDLLRKELEYYNKIKLEIELGERDD